MGSGADTGHGESSRTSSFVVFVVFVAWEIPTESEEVGGLLWPDPFSGRLDDPGAPFLPLGSPRVGFWDLSECLMLVASTSLTTNRHEIEYNETYT